MSTSSANLSIAVPSEYVRPIDRRVRLQLSAWAGQLFDWLGNPWVLLLCKLTIGFVSAYDIFLTVKYYETLPSLELNPIGRWMMMLDRGPECELNQIAAFITAKFAGNFLVLCVIELLVKWKQRAAAGVALGVAGFQLLLFGFLLYSDWFK
jgi:hypothetical protein